jgi:hypothetical protein
MRTSITMQFPPTAPYVHAESDHRVASGDCSEHDEEGEMELNFEELDAELFGPEPDAQTPCDHQSEKIHSWVVDQGEIRQELDIRRAYERQRIFREDQTELLVSGLGTSSDNEG